MTEEEKRTLRLASQKQRSQAKPGELPGRVLLGPYMRAISAEMAKSVEQAR